MINANELRIGNWVQAPLGEYMQVEILGHDKNPDYIFARGNGEFGQNGFDGISLTPEILEACGFEWDDIDKGNEIVRGLFKEFILMLPHHNGLNWYASPYGYPLMPQCTLHLHQLQNLYFALTQTELLIKL